MTCEKKKLFFQVDDDEPHATGEGLRIRKQGRVPTPKQCKALIGWTRQDCKRYPKTLFLFWLSILDYLDLSVVWSCWSDVVFKKNWM